ncbi:MAG: cation-translocating P-type ATPase [Verrucomicrobia bacterium]|nr:cation-translocating P-type ATPase [Verrucomicrobiota bacterium]
MTELRVNGMTCGNCARKVTTALQAVPGVHSVAVNLEARRASVRWHAAAATDTGKLLAALAAAGYDAKLAENKSAETNRTDWHFNLWLGGGVTVALMLGEWVFGVAMQPWFQWLAFALAAVVQIYCGAEFYRGAWRQLKAGSSNMDTLVALGSTTAFAFSAWALLSGHGGHVYFMEAAGIITLISIGHWLEARVGARASGALKNLLQLAPPTARKIQKTESGKLKAEMPFDIRKFAFSNSALRTPHSEIETEVPVADLRPGDLVALRPGDRVPVDGIVTEGDSAVDEAILTGESVPVDKKIGSELFAGTVNLNGRLVMRVTATGEATALANIIAAVQRAQTSRANIQRLGDRVSNVFVPVVVVIAVAAAFWWGLAPEAANHVHAWLAPFLWPAHLPTGAATAFIVAAAVLIVACPCAMGLATPAAIMAAANAAARRGILIRDGVALEKAGEITAVIFDKTGTLTEGRPKVVANQTFPIQMSTELKSFKIEELASSLSSLSSHPLSKSVAEISTTRLSLKGFKEFSGRGVVAMLEAGHLLQLGSLRWLEEEKVELEAVTTFADEWMTKGATVLGFAVDNRLVAVFALQDTLKPTTAKALEHLRYDYLTDGYRIYLLSGDSSRTVHAIATKLDIPHSHVFAEVRPEQKAEFVKKLQARGERVAFVGDGINDAPALTQADLGIAVSRASDVAREAADIILLKSEIEAVPEALGLARAALRTIRQNLFWAFFYNALGVPLAALGFMSPILCAAAMGVSDLIVIGNALRLARWRGKG